MIQWDRHISLGDLLTAATMLIVGSVAYATVKADVSYQAAQIAELKQQQFDRRITTLEAQQEADTKQRLEDRAWIDKRFDEVKAGLTDLKAEIRNGKK